MRLRILFTQSRGSGKFLPLAGTLVYWLLLYIGFDGCCAVADREAPPFGFDVADDDGPLRGEEPATTRKLIAGQTLSACFDVGKHFRIATVFDGRAALVHCRQGCLVFSQNDISKINVTIAPSFLAEFLSITVLCVKWYVNTGGTVISRCLYRL